VVAIVACDVAFAVSVDTDRRLHFGYRSGMRSLWVWVLVGCGKVSSNPDAMGIDAPHVDAASDGTAAACDPAKPFGSIVELSSVSTTVEDSAASLSADELTMYLSSRTVGGPSQIFVATRPDVTSTFSTPTALAQVNIGDSFTPSVTADGLTMYLISNGTGSVGGHDVFVSTRANTVAAFGAPSDVGNINSTDDNEYSVTVTGDGADLYFQSSRSGLPHVYHSTRSGSGFATPAIVTEIEDNTVGETKVAVRADGLELYFASTRVGGAGAEDIWVARRSSRTAPFGTPTNVTELNSAQLDEPSWVSADGCRILFASSRPGGKGDRDIWMATRPK
jgi:hypothetical protein